MFVYVGDVVFICVIQIWWDRESWPVAGLGLWWLITIHLAAAVNIDSSRDFQFEPCDILWNITKCVEVRKEIGRKWGGRSGPQGKWITPLAHPSSPFSCLSICLTSKTLHFYQFEAIELSMSSYSLLLTTECCASSLAYQTHWSLICSQLLSLCLHIAVPPSLRVNVVEPVWIQMTLFKARL